ncbi:MAG: betaine/proline/choline family ABC transporter ATP-binding protein [Proteobacteria bacterium]|nr:betaine/proline/choline family ABC transporter ATP-binding protein [Pseudomonadota bacterium]
MSDVLLSCRKVWKVFGPQPLPPTRELEGLGTEELTARGLVAAVRDASLDVREGEIFVIMGLSGSGKSTLVRCLSRLIEPSGGEILFRGEDLLTADTRRMIEIRRKHMGMVFQNFALLPHLTVLENVAFPLDIQGMERKARAARAQQMVELVGLKGKESFYPRQLSGGQQQRVGIARSLAVEPDLWFLDEPFSALDPLIRREMQDEFLRLQGSLKKTIVFITHDFDEAIRLADRIAVMKDGVIEQAASPEEIILRPATPYVAKFTENVPRAKVIRVEKIMVKPKAKSYAARVPVRSNLAEAAKALKPGVAVVGVVDASGAFVGEIRREALTAQIMAG